MAARNAGDGVVPARWRRLLALPVACLVACLLAGTAAGCTSGAAGPTGARGTVRLGLLAPLTGADAAAGTQAKRGAQLAVDLVNNPSPEVRLPVRAGHGGLAD